MKGKSDWYKSKIDTLVEAAECIAYNNNSNGKPLYDVYGYFPKWIADIVYKKLNALKSQL